MLTKTVSSSTNNYALAKMVSNAGFRRLMSERDFKQYGRQIKKLLQPTGIDVNLKYSIQDLVELSYSQLSTNYRHEYLYKNAILNSYVIEHYSLTDTILLNEFRISNSKADAVLVNGTNKVFEIKTELDTPERLNSQLKDYFKAFSEVFIVTHHTLSRKYISEVEAHVGIMVFTDFNTVEVVREARPNHSGLDTVVMMKALRKEEYIALVRNLLGSVPMVSPVKLFSECVAAIKHLPVETIQSEFLNIIKQRINLTTNKIIIDKRLPEHLKFSCYHNNLDENGYLALIKRLNYQL